ncbi:MAG: GNAT family N-acetyltransferase [Maricaulaceae bacterium]
MAVVEIPVLETERLVLRAPDPDGDIGPWADWSADPQFMRFLGGVKDEASAWRHLALLLGHWQVRGYGFFSVTSRESGRFIGLAGPWFPRGWPEPEIGWSIGPEFQGRGYAHEAAARCLSWVFEDLGWPRVVHCIDPANAPSQKLARALGSDRLYRLDALPPFGVPVDVYGQTAEQWRKR